MTASGAPYTNSEATSLSLIAKQLLMRKGGFSANVLVVMTGTFFAQGLTIAATPLLARLYTPADFGVLALFVAINSFLSVVGTWRYELAVMLPEKDEEALNVLALSVLIALGMTGLSLACVLLFRFQIAGMIGEPQLAPWLLGVPISLLITALYQVFNFWSSRKKEFRRLAMARAGQSGSAVGTQLGMGMLGGGTAGLIVGWLSGQAVGAGILGGQVLRGEGKSLLESLGWSSLKSQFHRYRNFPLYNVPYVFIGNAAGQSVYPLLRVFTNVHVVGLFSLARRVIQLPFTLVTSAIGQVFFEKAATELKSSSLERFVVTVLKLQVATGTPFLILFLFYAKPIFRVAFGEVWAEGGVYAALLAISGFVEYLALWMDRIYDVQGRQRLALVMEFCRNVLIFGSLALALGVTHNPVLSTGIYVALDFLYLNFWIYATFKVANFSLNSLLTVGGLFVGVASVAALVVWSATVVIPGVAAFIFSTLLIVALSGFVVMRYAVGQFV